MNICSIVILLTMLKRGYIHFVHQIAFFYIHLVSNKNINFIVIYIHKKDKKTYLREEEKYG